MHRLSWWLHYHWNLARLFLHRDITWLGVRNALRFHPRVVYGYCAAHIVYPRE